MLLLNTFYTIFFSGEKMKKEDIRVIKTKKNLYNALNKLMTEKPFENIKVMEICEEALVNRPTFYAHFDDKYDLLNSMINDEKKNLIDKIKDNYPNRELNKKYILTLLADTIEVFEEHRKQFTSLYNNNRDSIAIDIVSDAINEEVLKVLVEAKLDTKGVPLKVIRDYYVGAFFGVINGWINDSNPSTKEELINYLDKLLPEI